MTMRRHHDHDDSRTRHPTPAVPHHLICALIFSVLLTSSSVSSAGAPCHLNDPGRTRGECTHIRNCKYQIGRLRVGAQVTDCGGRAEVCCPTAKTIAEKKCAQWLRMLHAPTTFAFGDQLSEKPVCAAVAYKEFIVGGRAADDYEYPHAVALGYGTNPDKLSFLCGATLISEQYLLTAAHCISNKNVGKPTYAVIGDVTLDTKKPNAKANAFRKTVPIESHLTHPEYKPPLIYNDIALLRLAKPLELDRYILPACIGTPITTPKKNANVEACGWGITDPSLQSQSNILQAVNISVVDTGICNQVYDRTSDKPYRYPRGIQKSQMCASGNEKDTCRGDSGGGLYVRQGQCLFHTIGVTSIGSKICGLGDPAVYTNVASYQDWIESVVWGSS